MSDCSCAPQDAIAGTADRACPLHGVLGSVHRVDALRARAAVWERIKVMEHGAAVAFLLCTVLDPAAFFAFLVSLAAAAFASARADRNRDHADALDRP